jgi:hypothetical protein
MGTSNLFYINEEGLLETSSQCLRQLLFLIDDGPAEGCLSGAMKETLPKGGLFPTYMVWYESHMKSKKIYDRSVTWNGVCIVRDEWICYKKDGVTWKFKVIDTIEYQGIIETTRVREIVENT